MIEGLDDISLSEVIEIYNEISSMIKSLQDEQNSLAESEKNG